MLETINIWKIKIWHNFTLWGKIINCNFRFTMYLSFMSCFIVENKYAAYEQRIGNVPTDALYKQMNVLEKVTDNALKVTHNTVFSL